MRARHLEVLVEEPSMEAFLCALLPRLLPEGGTFQVHPFQGKSDLKGKLEARLRAYARWLPSDWRVVVVVDRDQEDCKKLKRQLEGFATKAGLVTRSRARSGAWRLVNRLAIEELEAWYFGDWQAVHAAYPRVPADVSRRKGLRDPDAIAGGTWECFERLLRQHGYFRTGLRKQEAAKEIGSRFDAARCRSRSFSVFEGAIAEATA